MVLNHQRCQAVLDGSSGSIAKTLVVNQGDLSCSRELAVPRFCKVVSNPDAELENNGRTDQA